MNGAGERRSDAAVERPHVTRGSARARIACWLLRARLQASSQASHPQPASSAACVRVRLDAPHSREEGGAHDILLPGEAVQAVQVGGGPLMHLVAARHGIAQDVLELRWVAALVAGGGRWRRRSRRRRTHTPNRGRLERRELRWWRRRGREQQSARARAGACSLPVRSMVCECPHCAGRAVRMQCAAAAQGVPRLAQAHSRSRACASRTHAAGAAMCAAPARARSGLTRRW